jgi:tetratricopeptide (TPR) repeat protein
MVKTSGILTMLLILFVGGGVAWYVWDSKQPKTFDQFMESAQAAIGKSEFQQAKKFALGAHELNPADNRALLVASVAASMDGKFEDAIELLREPNKDSEFYVDCVERRGIGQLSQGYIEDARASLKEVIALEPLRFDSNLRMFRLLRVEGRNWEARPYVFRINQIGRHSINAALVLASIEAAFIFEDDDKEFLELAQKSDPDYTLLLIGQARIMYTQGEVDRSLRMLDTVLEKYPAQIEAVAQKGWILLRENRLDEYEAWRKALPPECLKHPLVWQILGTKAEADGNIEMAARCFWEALRLHPHHSGSNTGLARTLRILDRKKEATPFAKRGRLARELEEFVTEGKPKEDFQIQIMIDRLEEMRRIPEVMGWCVLGMQKNIPGMETKLKSLQQEWGNQPGTIADEDNPAKAIDLSDYPLPDGITIDYEI